ncbi:MAG TPA: peptidylprolyl isomerase [Burkholderiaceae bacterium]|nr:peptidylprolyl isomerase [Burkholderiaceae bacterium]
MAVVAHASIVSAQQPAATTSTQPRALDAVVAVVNDEIITRNELDARVRQIERQLRSQNVQLPALDVFERQVLERMILERAQVQLAKENGIRVDDVTLDRTIARIAEGNKMTLQQFRDRVESEGTRWPRFREDIRDEILMARVREREVEQRVQVTDSEIDEFLRRQQDGSAVEANIAQILVRVPENATPEQVAARRQRAEGALRDIRGGADFARVAIAVSDGFDAARGGEMGWRPLDRYPQLFVDTVQKLQPGEVSDIVRSAAGFHVLKLVGRRNDAPQAQTVTQTHARHVLLRTGEQGLTDAEAQRRLLEYKQRIENKTMDFADVAKRYSRDGSAGNGGDLGWLLPGDTVPEFERAMNALQPGQISEPVQSPFGWHLIQVIERKTGELPKDRLRFAARQAVRDRKAEEQFQDWLRQLRDRAYVEVRLDGRAN